MSVVTNNLIAEEVARGEGRNLSDVAADLPPGRGKKPVNPSTLARWVLTGCRAADGTRVRLEACRVGGRWVTSGAALQRFFARTSALPEPAAEERTPDRRTRESRAAAEELATVHGI